MAGPFGVEKGAKSEPILPTSPRRRATTTSGLLTRSASGLKTNASNADLRVALHLELNSKLQGGEGSPAPSPLNRERAIQEISKRVKELRELGETIHGKEFVAAYKQFLNDAQEIGSGCPLEANAVLVALQGELVKKKLVKQSAFDKVVGTQWNGKVQFAIRAEQQKAERDVTVLIQGNPSLETFQKLEEILERLLKLGVPSAEAMQKAKEYFQTNLAPFSAGYLCRKVDQEGIKDLFYLQRLMDDYGIENKYFSTGLREQTKQWILTVEVPEVEEKEGPISAQLMNEIQGSEMTYRTQIQALVVVVKRLVVQKILTQEFADELILGLEDHIKAQLQLLEALPKPHEGTTGNEKFALLGKRLSKGVLGDYLASMVSYVATFNANPRCLDLLDGEQLDTLEKSLKEACDSHVWGALSGRPLEMLRMTPVQRGPRLRLFVAELEKSGISNPFFALFKTMIVRACDLANSVQRNAGGAL